MTETYGDCNICLEPLLKTETLEYLPCCHGFHYNCITPWLNEKTICPVCKINILRYADSNNMDFNNVSDSGGDDNLPSLTPLNSMDYYRLITNIIGTSSNILNLSDSNRITMQELRQHINNTVNNINLRIDSIHTDENPITPISTIFNNNIPNNTPLNTPQNILNNVSNTFQVENINAELNSTNIYNINNALSPSFRLYTLDQNPVVSSDSESNPTNTQEDYNSLDDLPDLIDSDGNII